MEESVDHKAVVLAVSLRTATLRILDRGDCGGCRLAMVCGGDSEPVVEVALPPHPIVAVGDSVVVTASSRTRLRAIWLFAVAPLLSLLAGVVLVWLAGGDEALMALAALAAVVVCFVVLYLLRGRLSGDLIWKIADYD